MAKYDSFTTVEPIAIQKQNITFKAAAAQEIEFVTQEGTTIILGSNNDLSSSMQINGNLEHLMGASVLSFRESSCLIEPTPEEAALGSVPKTWTFYSVATEKGTVSFQWKNPTQNDGIPIKVDIIKPTPLVVIDVEADVIP